MIENITGMRYNKLDFFSTNLYSKESSNAIDNNNPEPKAEIKL